MQKVIDDSMFNCEMIFSSPLLSCLTNVSTNFGLLPRFMDLLITHDFHIIYKIIAQFVASTELVRDWGQNDGNNDIYGFLKNQMYEQIYDTFG